MYGENIYQIKFACTVDENGKYGGYEEFAQNGQELVVFDKDRTLYIPMTFQAEIITQFYNKHTFDGHRDKYRMEVDCPKWLHSFLKFAAFALERKVRPEVKVWGRQQSDGVTRLQCLVYGFHPRAVDVKWVRNGVDHLPSDLMTPILPHPDGTYQIRVTVEVPTTEGDTYSCHVDHSSLEEILIVKLGLGA
ncbi:major histocompatibility complex class I-related gene protein-like [Mantella aurantiaca]